MLDVRELILIVVIDGFFCFCDRCGQCFDEDDYYRYFFVFSIFGLGCFVGCKYMFYLLKEIGQGDLVMLFGILVNYFEYILSIVGNILFFFGLLKKNELYVYDCIIVD